MSAPNGVCVCVCFFFAASKKSGNDRNILRISNFKIAFIITNVVLVIWSRHTKQIGYRRPICWAFLVLRLV